jgi:hypothetical protein
MISSTHASAPHQQRGASSHEEQDWMPLAAGAAVILLALARKSTLLKMATVFGGGYLLLRAIENGSLRLPPELADLRSPRELMDKLREQIKLPVGGSLSSSPRYDRVDEASMESFPGSDPPASY